MPDRILRHGRQVWDGHSQGILLTLLVATLVVAIWGWSRASSAETRVSRVEIEQQAEEAAAAEGKKISQVVTCFSTARGRPLLTVILRSLASGEHDPIVRNAYDVLIDNYEAQSVPGIDGPPTRTKCAALGDKLGVDYRAYDFDPRSGRLLARDD